jgi:hypothetical protein
MTTNPNQTAHHPTRRQSDLSPQKSLASIIRTIYCQKSGVVLGQLEVLILEGHLAYLEAHDEAVYEHPFYRMSQTVLLKKLEDALHHCQNNGWVCTHAEQQRLQLLVSAVMHHLGCVKQEGACLPSFTVAASSAGRLLGIAKWFFYVSSQRLQFTTYSISTRNQNLQWENFKHWLDTAYEIRNDWSKNKKEMQREAELRLREESIRTIKSEHFKRVDTKKVWNWVHLQLADHYAPGRLETFKSIFMDGDINAHEWNTDDIDDVSEAILKHCDIGNEIMYFIRKRLDGILGLVKDFGSSFTLITRVQSDKFGEGSQTPEEALFFSEFDKKAEALETLPPAPKREDFESLGKFLKAQANWNILSKRWKQSQSRKESQSLVEASKPKQPQQPQDDGIDVEQL